MFSKIKTEVLTDEEKKDLNLKDNPDYMVRFTNKNNGKVLYVGVNDMRPYGNWREVEFGLYDSDCKLVSGSSVEIEDSFSFDDSRERALYFSTAKAFRKAASHVEGEGRKLYKKAALAAAVVAEKRDELEAKRQKAAEKLRKEQQPVFKAMRDFFGR